MATFITSKAVGEDINIYAETSTGYWKYNHDGSDSSVFGNGWVNDIPVANANGEFVIISCDSDGIVSGDVTYLNLQSNQLTSFDGTGLSSLTYLGLNTNQLTSFDGTDLSSLTTLDLQNNQLTSFDGTGLSSLTHLYLSSNQLTSLDVSMMTLLNHLELYSNKEGTNPMTATSNDAILAALVTNGLIGTFLTAGGRTLSSNTDYDNLVSLGWNLQGLDLVILPTFITSKAVGETINIYVQTSTGYWKYNHDGSDSSVNINGFGFNNSSEIGTPVTNANGEFTIIPCDSEGTTNGDLTMLRLDGNQITLFDGTDLSSLTHLDLRNNQLTSFDGTDLTSLTQLSLAGNQLTSFDATGLPNLVGLSLGNNQLTSFDGTGLSSLTDLDLIDNQLTSFDGTGLSSLIYLYLNGNQLTSSVNNQILHQLALNGLSGGEFYSSNGRTSASNADYDNLLKELGWYFEGLDLIIPPTFITSKAVGQDIDIYAETSTGYWKYNHDGSDSSVNTNGWVNDISVTNANGEFTIISCDESGTVSGDVTYLALNNNQLTSFDGTGLSSLTELILSNNQLTSLDGFIFPTSLTGLDLQSNQLTSFDGTGLSSLTELSLYNNQLTSFDGNGLSSLTQLQLQGNLLTSFDGTGLSSLTYLSLQSNQLTSFDGTGLSSLTNLSLQDNLLTSLDISPLVVLSYLRLYTMGEKDNPDLTNPMTPSSNNQILFDLSQHSINGGEFLSSNGRTSASNTDYDNLISLGWYFEGLDLITTTPPTFITSKTIGETINIGIITSTGFWKYNHDGVDSSVFGQGEQSITITNANGEFTIISCLSDGTVSGDVIELGLQNNQLTSFDGTGLTSLTSLNLDTNQLTSFDGTDLSSLTTFGLNRNQLTSFNGTGLTSLTGLDLNENQLTSFDGTDLSSLTYLSLAGNQLTSFNPTGLTSLDGLYLQGNQLTSFDGTGLSSLTHLVLNNNQLTSSVNNQTLNLLDQYGLSDGYFSTSNGRTADGTADYDSLISKGWTIQGANIPLPPTFITSKSVGETINIFVRTSTGFWKYNHDGSDSSVFENGWRYDILVTNANGEFTIISCDESGNVSGDVTNLALFHNQLTSFDGTVLTSLTGLGLDDNQLTSLDGFIFPTSLTTLQLGANQLTSFDGTGLSGLTELWINDNQLTSLSGFIFPTSLNRLFLGGNQLTSFDVTGLTSLTGLNLDGNLLTPSSNNQILNQLNQNGLSNGYFSSTNGRTSASNADYDNLISLGWYLGGLDLPPPTFITSKAVGENIDIYVQTSTEYWKYNHDGSDSSVFANGSQSPTITNANGEFTIISCDSDGNVSGDVTYLGLQENQITSFDGTGLSSLTQLDLYVNQLTSFDGTGLSSLTDLRLWDNPLTSFDGTGLTSLTQLGLNSTQLTSFDGTGLSSLTNLSLNGPKGGGGTLTSVSNLPTSLIQLSLGNNQLTSFDGTGLTSLTNLSLESNQLISFDGTGLSSLNYLYLSTNQLTSFDGTGLSSLIQLSLNENQLTSFDETGLSSLTALYLIGNQLTSSINNQILHQLNQNGLSGGYFGSSNGRTSASNTDYDNLLNNLGWGFSGLDLVTVVKRLGVRRRSAPVDGGQI